MEKEITLKLPPKEIINRFEANPIQFLEAEAIEMLSKTNNEYLKLEILKTLRTLIDCY